MKNKEILETVLMLEHSIDEDLKNRRNPSSEKMLDLIFQIEGLQAETIADKNEILMHTAYVKHTAMSLLKRTLSVDYETVYWRTILAETPYSFESYLMYIEKDRPFEQKFYEPRRRTLKVIVQDLQDLEDRKLKFLGVSLPARTGKSTTCIFFLSWIACKRPESNSAMGGHSGRLANSFYRELLNIFTSKEYCFGEIYAYMNPNCDLITSKSADDLKISLKKSSRFATITCRGIDGTWTGDVNVSSDGYLYVDDLIRDRTHSLSPTRMEGTYQEYLNKMCDRKNDGARELMVGTLWNVNDPLERERLKNGDNEQYRFRKIPALDYETGESNFQYDVGGFSTEYYMEMKSRLDEAEWEAKYQQRPFVREGLLFNAEEMEYFDGVLPEGNYKAYAVVDVALGGGDYLSMPVAMFNEKTKEAYVVDWLYNKGTKQETEPLILQKIHEHGITKVQFEKNAGGGLFKESVEEKVKENGMMCIVTSVSAPNNMSKEQKIEFFSPEIKKLKFITPLALPKDQLAYDRANGVKRYVRNKDYTNAMDDLLMFVLEGKNLHDDSPDSLAQLVSLLYGNKPKQARIIKSPL